MSARIQELESALARAQSSGPGGTHPLLAEPTPHDTDLEKTYDSDLKEISDAIGSISLGPSGKATYRGEMAASEVNDFLVTTIDCLTRSHQYFQELLNPVGHAFCTRSRCAH